MLNSIFKRRFVVATSLFFLASTYFIANVYAEETPSAKRWYKCEFHSHSMWSDGRALPEVLAHTYLQEGYNFVCMTDHNVMQTPELRFSSWGYGGSCPDEKAFEGENSYWKPIVGNIWSHLGQAEVDEAIRIFGADSLKTKEIGGQTWVRLKTNEELKAQFDKPGEFLLTMGFEQTSQIPNFGHLHMNFINVSEIMPCYAENNSLETIRKNYEEGVKKYGKPGRNWIFTVNHPMWQYYSVSPSDLIALPEIRLVELTNNSTDYVLDDSNVYPFHPKGWSPEKFWDVVNAFRCSRGQRLLFAAGSSDRHFDYPEHPEMDVVGWTNVLADELTPEAILEATTRGDCYSSNGLNFKKLEFDRETKTLTVAVDAQPGAKYRIDFIGTRRGFDETCEKVVSPAGLFPNSPERTIEVYSDDIGVVFKTVDCVEASYQLQDDDLYVRARAYQIDEQGAPILATPPEPEYGERWPFPKPTAWTQPFSTISR